MGALRGSTREPSIMPMRLLSYLKGGREHLGARDGDQLIDLAAARAAGADAGAFGPDRSAPSTILQFLAGGDEALGLARETIAFARAHDAAIVDESTVQLLPVIPRPPKIICVARNYAEHAAEANLQVLEVPNLFIRFPRSLVGHGAPVVVPTVSRQVDWEAELAVVVGRAGKHVRAADAYQHVAGYAPFNDVSIRDWQLRKPPVQFGAGKNFDGSGPFGPELITRDEVADPHALRIGLKVNGEVMQSSSTSNMIFDIPTLIEHISQFTTLEPGDVIATGTPSGVGHFRQPPTYLEPGDTVRVEIEGMAALENPVVAET
jgi:2-keto-4-pentenoate hydratase/2-oxohepta-3-ene-1,7-dioic acid hydratase in catechol pathway